MIEWMIKGADHSL